jgi:transglutaminase-like putative cysteine protease
VTPWIAAKELVRATVNAYRAYDDDGIRIENGFPRGIVFNGARATLAAGSGTSHDCVAACVTVLRTAGIPARAVLGMTEVDSSSSGTSRTRLVSWAEFWLPQAGWIPFSPDLLRSQARGGLNVERPWKYFGSWDGLNECIPLCYGWELPVAGHRSMPFPAGFVWNSSMTPDQYARINDRIALQILGRGRAKE